MNHKVIQTPIEIGSGSKCGRIDSPLAKPGMFRQAPTANDPQEDY